MELLSVDLEREIGYVFHDRGLFEEALTHASYANESGRQGCNERLEFLGDAVLELVVSQMLYLSSPNMDEGGLSKARSHVVRETTLASWARAIRLPILIKIGRGLEGQGGRHNPSILADAMEAVFGAVFLDGGYSSARDVIMRLVSRNNGNLDRDEEGKDAKSLLQERLQAHGEPPPAYRLIRRTGPDHAASFEVEATAADGRVLSAGSGNSIKTAEFRAARKALELFKDKGE
ncbi:MAG: ribonuclease III [Synergistaceae bacterium]|jgi:ribonuclease-3|nr:ribonuclease III [Synergistaceae bacterium]